MQCIIALFWYCGYVSKTFDYAEQNDVFLDCLKDVVFRSQMTVVVNF